MERELAELSSDLKEVENLNRQEVEFFETKLISLEPVFSQLFTDYYREQNGTKSGFNVFNCLTKHHLEELHSKFIGYLLDPNETHNCGTIFLALFVKCLNTNDGVNRLIAGITESDLLNAKIKREKSVRDSMIPDNYGRVDLFIEMPCLNIAIENKIWAGEQESAIERYVKYCKVLNKPYAVFYLTLRGDFSQQAGNEKYETISYNHDILNWLSACEEATSHWPRVAAGISFYKDLLANSILKHSTNHLAMDIKNILLKDENKILIKYLEQLCEAKVQIRNQLREEFFQGVFKEFCNEGYGFKAVRGVVHPINIREIWAEKYRGFTLFDERYILKLDSDESVIFSIEHGYEEGIYFGLIGLKNDDDVLSTFTLKEEKASILKNIIDKMDDTFLGRYDKIIDF